MALDDDIPEGLLGDVALVREGPQDRLAEIYRNAAELARITQRIAVVEAELQRLRDDKYDLSARKLPKLFDEVNTDTLGVPGYNADIVLTTRIHAAIRADWEEEARERGFAEVERLKGEDLIKVTVSVDFGKDEFDLAARFVRHIQGINWLEGRVAKITKGVHWATLSKWVAQLIEKRVPVNLAALGASVSRTCDIVQRK